MKPRQTVCVANSPIPTRLSNGKCSVGSLVMLNGHMTVGVSGPDIIVRVGAESYEATLTLPGTSGFGPAGRTMKGWVLVDAGAVESEADLADWVQRAVSYTGSLEPK